MLTSLMEVHDTQAEGSQTLGHVPKHCCGVPALTLYLYRSCVIMLNTLFRKNERDRFILVIIVSFFQAIPSSCLKDSLEKKQKTKTCCCETPTSSVTTH